MRTKLAVASIICLCVCDQAAAKKNSVTEQAIKALARFAENVLANLAAAKAGEMIGGGTTKPSTSPGAASATSQPVPYAFTLAWQDPEHGGMYIGRLKMRGLSGSFRVMAGGMVVDQLVNAERSPNGKDIILNGSFPRIAGTLQPAPGFVADRFRLTEAQPGIWTIADTCDYSNKCAPVYVIASAIGSEAE
jgi:hypothetical protein